MMHYSINRYAIGLRLFVEKVAMCGDEGARPVFQARHPTPRGHELGAAPEARVRRGNRGLRHAVKGGEFKSRLRSGLLAWPKQAGNAWDSGCCSGGLRQSRSFECTILISMVIPVGRWFVDALLVSEMIMSTFAYRGRSEGRICRLSTGFDSVERYMCVIIRDRRG